MATSTARAPVACALSIFALLFACGSDEASPGGPSSSNGPPKGDDAGTANVDGGPPAPPVPTTACEIPAKLADTTTPTTKVGDGSPDSCTEANLRTAVT